MAVVDIRRPSSTGAAGNWVTSPSGSTLHARTSDQSNTTGAIDGAIDGPLVAFTIASHTPPAGHERHRFRGFAAATCTSTSAVYTGTVRACSAFDVADGITAAASLENRSLNSPITTSWKSASFLAGGAKTFGLRFANVRTGDLVTGPFPFPLLAEAWLEIDSRAKPTFVADVKDGAGVSQAGGDITDTSRARLTFGTQDLDGLPSRDWSVEVAEQGTGIVRFAASGSDAPPETILTSPLAVGSYTATFNLSSTIRGTDAFAADEDTIDFDLSFVAPAPTASVPNTVSGLKLHFSALTRKRGERGL